MSLLIRSIISRIPLSNSVRSTQSLAKVKRFYKLVDVKQENDKWLVTLDGRALKTPGKTKLALPTETMASAIALEWDAQIESIKPYTMPIMQLASTATDCIPSVRDANIKDFLRYLETDTLSIQFPNDDTVAAALRERQVKHQQPILDLITERFGASLGTQAGIAIAEHPEKLVKGVEAFIHGLDNWRMIAVHTLASTAKSACIAVAVYDRKLGVDDAIAAARVEEEFQIDRFGLCEGSHDMDRANINTLMWSSDSFLRMLPEA